VYIGLNLCHITHLVRSKYIPQGKTFRFRELSLCHQALAGIPDDLLHARLREADYALSRASSLVRRCCHLLAVS
jgi:hypothetical protein